MPLAPLADVVDLQVRGIDDSDSALSTEMLAVASASIRAAAGCPISRTTSTITVPAWGDNILRLPGVPLVSVGSVTVEGATVADYKMLPEGLWRSCGWGRTNVPALVTVTYTHGILSSEVPADIVDLACNLAAAGQAEARSLAAGGSFDPRTVVESIDDYRVQYSEGAEALGSVFDLPAGTRSRLRARFGGGASLVETR